MADLKLGNMTLMGNVKVPPSKSMAHRAIICASLSQGISKIENIDFSDDIIATMEAMKALGAKIYQNNNYIEVHGINHNEVNKELKIIDCNESGSTLRFLVPISLLIPGKKKFIGRGNLGKRPLNTFYEIFEQDNIEYSFEEGVLNLQIEGTLKGGEYYLAGNISSQFITGLLFTLPLINRDSKIVITTEMESKGYIDLTLSALRDFGIEIINNDYKEFIIKGNQEYKARNYKVEGDYSQAAFFLVANAIGNKVEIDDVLANPFSAILPAPHWLIPIPCPNPPPESINCPSPLFSTVKQALGTIVLFSLFEPSFNSILFKYLPNAFLISFSVLYVIFPSVPSRVTLNTYPLSLVFSTFTAVSFPIFSSVYSDASSKAFHL